MAVKTDPTDQRSPRLGSDPPTGERIGAKSQAPGDTSDRPPTSDHALNEQPTSIQIQASVIMKKAALKNETAKWRDDPSTLRQRTFWSVQARSVRAENHALNEQPTTIQIQTSVSVGHEGPPGQSEDFRQLHSTGRSLSAPHWACHQRPCRVQVVAVLPVSSE